MSFNRLKYDSCEVQKSANESVASALYSINTPIACGQCFQKNPEIIMQKSGDSLNGGVDWRFYAGPVDVESDLRNINRPSSKCPSDKYQPSCKDCTCDNQGAPCGQGVSSGCKAGSNCKLRKNGQRCEDNNLVDFPDCYFPTDSTRISNPSCTLRGTGINRFDPLCLDPQDQVLFPGVYQVPSRLVVKDNHRPCVPTPAVNNMNPPPKNLPCNNTTPVCASYNGTLYQYDKCG